MVVQSLDTGQRDVILNGRQQRRYMPTGHLLYVLGWVLFAISYDVATHKVRGAPVPVVESCSFGAGCTPARWEEQATNVSDDGTLAYGAVENRANGHERLGDS